LISSLVKTGEGGGIDEKEGPTIYHKGEKDIEGRERKREACDKVRLLIAKTAERLVH